MYKNFFLRLGQYRFLEKLLILFIYLFLQLNIVFNCKKYDTLSNIIAIYLICLSVYILLILWKNLLLRLMFIVIVYTNYSVCAYYYIFNDGTRKFFIDFNNDKLLLMNGLNVLLVFMTVIVLFLPKNIKVIDIDLFINKDRKNSKLIVAISIYIFLAFLLGYDRGNVLLDRGIPSTYYEYSTIFFILGYYFCGNNKLLFRVLNFLISLYFVQGIICSSRAISVQLFFLYFVLRYKSIPAKKILFFSFVFINFFIGFFRKETSLIYYFLNSFNLKNAINCFIKNIYDYNFSWDTALAAYSTSLSSCDIHKYFTFIQRMSFLKDYIKTLIVGSNNNFSFGLAAFLRNCNHYNHGGTILPFYFNFFLGYVGVIFLALLLNLYINLMNKFDSSLGKIISIYVLISSFRWYLYSPQPLFRGVCLLCIVYFCCNIFDKFNKYGQVYIKNPN
ncbi:MAG: hypothetical protein LBS28_05220 [Streptococcaceae bacterium]|jgi:hypothetical protein|nr:hypothetical protein [Streptococcaceae bacterium]